VLFIIVLPETPQARRDSEEVRSILPRRLALLNQTQIRLIYDGRRLESVAGALFAHQIPGNAMQFLLYGRRQIVQTFLLTIRPANEHRSDTGRVRRLSH